MTNNIPESQIVKIWQHQLLKRTDLVTEEGEPLRVIYPGRINDDRGADLRDAVIATKQGVIKGDIEVHVKSRDWRTHRHHQDAHCNRVILHVVFWHDAGTPANLQNGKKVYTLALHRYIKKPAPPWLNPVCPPANFTTPCRRSGIRLNNRSIGEFLDKTGEERFFAKAAGFQADLTQIEAGQTLYQGMMGALGYAKNKLPFLQLSRRLPLQTLESLTRGEITDAECLARQQALLLGTAGLLPSQRASRHHVSKDNHWVEKLEEIWGSSHQNQEMSENDWNLFKVRPNNFPIRRIAAMSHLILRYTKRGILEETIETLREAPKNTGGHELEKALLVTTNGYWASHLDFGLPSRLIMPTLLGGRRAADIIVNVLLPFTFA